MQVLIDMDEEDYKRMVTISRTQHWRSKLTIEQAIACGILDVYTKDEVIAMLTELRQKLDDKEESKDKKWSIGLRYSEKIIQQKINELKGYVMYTDPQRRRMDNEQS